MVGRFAGWLINFPGLPNWVWQFKYYILHIARLYFVCGLVFNMQKMSIVLNLDNSVSGSPLEIPFAGLLLLEIYPITYFKRGWCPVQGLLCSFEVILIQCFLGNGQCKSVCFKIQQSRIWVSQESLHGPLVADVGVNLDPFHILRKMGFLL